MDATRAAACALAQQGRLDITQRGVVMDPAAALRGPIRLRLSNKLQQQQQWVKE
jgi:Protein of unknown function (DUF3253)